MKFSSIWGVFRFKHSVHTSKEAWPTDLFPPPPPPTPPISLQTDRPRHLPHPPLNQTGRPSPCPLPGYGGVHTDEPKKGIQTERHSISRMPRDANCQRKTLSPIHLLIHHFHTKSHIQVILPFPPLSSPITLHTSIVSFCRVLRSAESTTITLSLPNTRTQCKTFNTITRKRAAMTSRGREQQWYHEEESSNTITRKARRKKITKPNIGKIPLNFGTGFHYLY